MADTQYTDPDAQLIASYGKSQSAQAAQTAQYSDPDAQAIAAYQSQPAQAVPSAVANPSGFQLPQAVQDIRDFVTAHGLGGSPQDMFSAAAHNVAKPLHGAAQLIEHGLGGAANLVAPDSSAARFLSKDNAQNDAALAQWENAYQNSTPTNGASLTGAAAGNVLPLMLGAGNALGQAGDYMGGLLPKALSFLKPTVSGATQGAVLGAAQPVTAQSPGQTFAQQKLAQTLTGAATGGGINGLVGLAGGAANAMKPLLNPTATARDYLGNLLGDQAPSVLQNLQNAPTFVPGSVPTTAQVGGSPELVMAEKALGNQFPAFKAAQMTRANENNAARLSALQGVAGTPADLNAALAGRKGAAAPQIDQLLTNGNPVPVQPVLDALSSLKDSSLGVRPTIKGAISDIQSEISSRAKDGTIPPDILDGLRQNIGDYLRKNAPNGAVGTQEGVAFGPVQDQITQAIDRANPGYSDYLANYARMSQPITDARAASGILDRLGNGSLNSAQQVQLNPRGFNAAMNKATSGPYPLSPNAQSTLEGIQNDLQRDTVSNAVKSPGSDTAYNLNAGQWLSGKIPKLIGGAVGNFIPGVGAMGGFFGTEKLASGINSRVGNAITDLMMNPAKAAAELQKLQQTNPVAAQALSRLLTQQGSVQAGQATGR